MGELEQLYEDVLGFYEDHDLELEDIMERRAFVIVISVLSEYATREEEN